MVSKLVKIKVIIIGIAVAITMVSCHESKKTVMPAHPEEIMVFAAASLTQSFEEIAEKFKQKKNVEVVFNFAGSQTLATSIIQGVKADVFASANMDYMKFLNQKGFIEESQIFAKNRLIICKNKKSRTTIKVLEDLSNSVIKLIVGDESVPVGKYFYTVLEDAVKNQSLEEEFKQKIIANIKSEELNVKDIVSKIIIGEADAGIVYRTDVNEKNMYQLEIVEMKEFEETEAKYTIGVVQAAPNNEAARIFVDFVVSSEGKEILKKYGFIVGN